MAIEDLVNQLQDTVDGLDQNVGNLLAQATGKVDTINLKAQQVSDAHAAVMPAAAATTAARDQVLPAAATVAAQAQAVSVKSVQTASNAQIASDARDAALALANIAGSHAEGVAYNTSTTGPTSFFAVKRGGLDADGVTALQRTTCYQRTGASTSVKFATMLSGDEFDSAFPRGFVAERSGYLHLWLDGNNRVLLGIKRDGTLWSKGLNLNDAATQAVTAFALATLAKDAGTAIAVKSRSTYLHEWWDSNKRLLLYIASNGDLYSKGINLTAAARAVNSFTVAGPERTRFLHQFHDTTNRLLGGFLKNGELEVKGVNISKAIAGVPSVLTEAFPSTNIAFFGDSLTEGAGTSGGQYVSVQLAALYSAAGQTRSVYASGFGGQSCQAILARFGAMPTQVTFPIPNGATFCQFPASGTVSVTVTGAPLSYADITQAKSMTGTIAGIAGTLTRLANTNDYTFTRATAGAAFNVSPGMPFIPDTNQYRCQTLVCWIGTNNMLSDTADQILAYIDAYVGYQATFQKRRVIVMPAINSLSGSVEGLKTKYAQLLALVKAKYPTEYVDTLFELQKNNNGDANDLADVAAGLAPRSLQFTDRYHLNNAGYGVIAAAIKSVLDLKGY